MPCNIDNIQVDFDKALSTVAHPLRDLFRRGYHEQITLIASIIQNSAIDKQIVIKKWFQFSPINFRILKISQDTSEFKDRLFSGGGCLGIALQSALLAIHLSDKYLIPTENTTCSNKNIYLSPFNFKNPNFEKQTGLARFLQARYEISQAKELELSFLPAAFHKKLSLKKGKLLSINKFAQAIIECFGDYILALHSRQGGGHAIHLHITKESSYFLDAKYGKVEVKNYEDFTILLVHYVFISFADTESFALCKICSD